MLNWITSQSAFRPLETDTRASKVYNYVRRNIHEVEVDNGEDGATTMFEYEELKIKKDAWPLYEELIQTKADIDYLNMITEDL